MEPPGNGSAARPVHDVLPGEIARDAKCRLAALLVLAIFTAPANAVAQDEPARWLVTYDARPYYSVDGALLGETEPGEWYRVHSEEDGWALVYPESGSAARSVWIQLGEGIGQVDMAQEPGGAPANPAQNPQAVTTAATVQPAARPPPTAPPPAKQKLVLFVGGWQPSCANSLGVVADPLTQRLAQSGATWEHYVYAPCQAIETSARGVANRVSALSAAYDVRVAGFSEGGTVALYSVFYGARPSAVLTIDSPIRGRNMAAVQSVCSRARRDIALAGLGGALVGIPPAAAAVMAVALAAALPCDHFGQPVFQNLAGIYADRNWYASWEAQVANAGVRLGTMGNSLDCMYHMYMCMNSWGSRDVDDRSVQWVGGRQNVTSWNYSVGQSILGRSNFGISDLDDSHHAILNDPGAMAEAARFLAQ